MTGHDFTTMRALYGRKSADRIDEQVEAADALAAQLQTLRTQPTADGAERVANQLHAMHRAAVQLVEALARDIAA